MNSRRLNYLLQLKFTTAAPSFGLKYQSAGWSCSSVHGYPLSYFKWLTHVSVLDKSKELFYVYLASGTEYD